MLDWVLVILLYYIILCTLSNSLIFLDFLKTVLRGAVAFVKAIQVRILFWSRCFQVLYEKAALKNFTKFIKIHQLWSPYLIKLQRISANLFKSRVSEFCGISKSSHQDCSSVEKRLSLVFSCEHCKIFKSTYFEKHLQTTFCGIFQRKYLWTTASIWNK